MPEPARRRFARPGVWLALLVTLAVAACTATAPDSGPDPSGTVRVSYDGGTEWLATLDPAQAGQQVQDWARLGLASALGMPTDRLAGELYDGAVLRDPSTADLVRQPVGPGRTLFDGTTLHLLVPASDRHRERTIGELLDGYRADRGADPPQVQVHTYEIDAADRSVTLTGEPAVPAAQARTDNGWLERRVDDPASLADFVTHVDQLSRLENRGGELWASGWDFPDVSADVTVADVSVLAGGYRRTSRSLPAFSLDAGPIGGPADLQAVTGISPALASAVLSGDYAGTGFGSADELRSVLNDALFRPGPPSDLAGRGLPTDRIRLWALFVQLTGGDAYGQAFYGGGLEGTEAGMTLFYTDYVAKDWTAGVGAGVPTGVPGFVPDSRAHTPAALCPPDSAASSNGRLWFGQNTAAFGYSADAVSIGRQATRLFFRTEGAGGREVEPDYQSGRGLSWFDQNYQAIADYEPQYRRLEQLMRWSGALEWLSLTGRSLPDTGASVPHDLRFAQWYGAHPELRERAPLSFVRPPSANQESVLTVPSQAFDDCGVTRVLGGVELSDALSLGGGKLPQRPSVPSELSRAAPTDPVRTSVDAAGNATIVRSSPSVQYRIRQVPGAAEIVTTGPAAGDVPFGTARLETGSSRAQTLTFRGSGRDYAFDQRSGDVSTGETTVTGTTDGARISVVGAIRARVAAFFERVRDGDAVRSPSYRYDYADGSGRVYGTAEGFVRSGPRSPSFVERFAATVVDRGGRMLRVAFGAPRELAATDVRNRRTQDAPIATVPAGRALDAFPLGTPVYTNDPALLAGAVPVTTPFELRTARPVDRSGTVPPGENTGAGQAGNPDQGAPLVVPTGGNAPPGGARPTGAPGTGGTGGPYPFPLPLPRPPVTTSPTTTTTAPVPTSAFGTPVGAGPWVLLGFGTGLAVATPSDPDAVGLVSACTPGTAGCSQ